MEYLPDEAWLGSNAHPQQYALHRLEHLPEPPFVHGAVSFVIHHLRLPHEVGHVAHVSVASGHGFQQLTAASRREVMFRPGICYAVPVFLGHHPLYRLQRRHRHGSYLGLERFGLVEILKFGKQ